MRSAVHWPDAPGPVLNPDPTGRLSPWPASAICSPRPRPRSPRSTRRRPTERRKVPGTVVLDVREPDEYDQGALPGRRPHPPRPPREPGRGPHPRPRRARRRLLRRRRALGLRGQDAGRARLHRRRVDGRRLRPVEGRGSGVDHAGHPDPGPAQPLPAPPAAARGGRRGPGQAARLQGAAAGRRRPRLTRRAVPGRGRRRHDRHRRHGRGRRLQPPAPDPPQPGPHRRPQGRLGQEDADGDEPRRRRRHLRHPALGRQRDGHARRATTSSSTAPTTSPAGTSSTTPR